MTYPSTASDEVDQVKSPPHSLEAEQSLLGGLMVDNSQWDALMGRLTAQDFYRREHQLIFAMMLRLANDARAIDNITLADELADQGQLDQVGGAPYLAQLAENHPNIGNLKAYAGIVHQRSILRQLIGVANDIAAKAYDPQGRRAEDLLDEAERAVFGIAEERPKDGGLININPLLKQTVERIDALYHSQSPITGVSTGYQLLDERTTGFQQGELIVVAARPSMGKTTLAMNFVEAAILSQSKPVLVFSLEMPAEQLVMRTLSSIGRIDQGRLRTGQLQEDDFSKLSAATHLLKDKPLFIDDTPGISPHEMRSRIRRVIREQGNVGLIMVDYLQLMKLRGFTEGRTAEISEISRSLKAIAKEFNCPVLALSQLNRGLEQRPNKRPVNSDLRESGAIEQDADLILFIYRVEVSK